PVALYIIAFPVQILNYELGQFMPPYKLFPQDFTVCQSPQFQMHIRPGVIMPLYPFGNRPEVDNGLQPGYGCFGAPACNRLFVELFYIVDLSLLFIDTQQEVFDLDMSPQYLQRMIARFLLFYECGHILRIREYFFVPQQVYDLYYFIPWYAEMV